MKKSYKVNYTKKSLKFLKKNKFEGIKFFRAFKEISEQKDMMQEYDVKKLVNHEFADFRLRIGKYRALFNMHNNELIILVIDIESRGQIYK